MLSSCISLWKQRGGEDIKLSADKLNTEVDAQIDLCVFFLHRQVDGARE